MKLISPAAMLFLALSLHAIESVAWQKVNGVGGGVAEEAHRRPAMAAQKLRFGKNVLSGRRCHILTPVTSTGTSSRGPSCTRSRSVNKQP